MAARKGPRKLYRYSAEFKLKAVKLSQIEGVRVQDVAEALEIHRFMLSKWRREAQNTHVNHNKFLSGWNKQRVKRVVSHNESQTEDGAVVEDEVVRDDTSGTMQRA